jgi:hypothetical protein
MQYIVRALLGKRLFLFAAFIRTSLYLVPSAAACWGVYAWDSSQPVNYWLKLALAIVFTTYWLLQLQTQYREYKEQ